MKSIPLIFLLQSLLTLSLQARTFTNLKGKKVQATVINVSNNSAQLKLDKNNKVYTIPLSKLSQADQDFLRAWEKKNSPTSSKTTDKKKKHSKQRKLSTAKLMEKYQLKENFDAEWPKIVSIDRDIEINVVKEDKENSKFIYQSPNYEFICDVRLSKNVVKKFAVLFEATREFCRLLPISTMKAHMPGEVFRNKILLFEHKSDYISNGGPPESGGVFIPRKGNIILIPLTSLGLKKVGSSYMYDHKGNNFIISHELTHQLTDYEYFASGANGWFSEGLAEYVAYTPYRSGKYMVRSNISSIKAIATAYGKRGRAGHALGEKFTAPDLETFMTQPYSKFLSTPKFSYPFSALLTYYFFHMEDDRSNINAFLKALKEGKKGKSALKELLNGRSFDELEKQITKAWKSRGIRINFQASP